MNADTLLDEMEAFCRKHAVSFSLDFEESDGNWRLEITSPAPAECFQIKHAGTPEDAWTYFLSDWAEKIGQP